MNDKEACKIKYIGGLLISLLILGGCAQLQPEQSSSSSTLTREDRVRVFDQDKYRVFNNIMEAFKNQGFSLETRDSNEGLIFTDYQLASTVGAPISGSAQVKVEAVLEERDQSTQVMLTLRVQQEVTLTDGQSSGVSPSEAKRYYQQLFEVISHQLSS